MDRQNWVRATDGDGVGVGVGGGEGKRSGEEREGKPICIIIASGDAISNDDATAQQHSEWGK